MERERETHTHTEKQHLLFTCYLIINPFKCCPVSIIKFGIVIGGGEREKQLYTSTIACSSHGVQLSCTSYRYGICLEYGNFR